jgi:nucleotide-binding universal stress UspA family protein
MYTRVLLCYDGTLTNRRAMREGADLIVHLHAEAHVLAIVPPTSLGAAAAAISGAHTTLPEDDYRRRAEDIAAHLRGRGVQAFGHLVFGTAIEQIPAFARRLLCDLIVVGHHSRSGIGRWWAGGENVALADRAPCSILISLERPD